MDGNENKKLGEEFKKMLNSFGIKDIKNIPVNSKPKEECRTFWVIK